MSKLLVVIGATGQQGGSVVDTVLNDAELSKQYKVRGITRDPTNAISQNLRQRGVEVIKGDVNDETSLQDVMRGAHTVYAMTGSKSTHDLTKEQEIIQGKTMADAAVAQGAKYFIWSTLPSTSKISHGKYTGNTHFDSKAEVEDYIRSLPIKSAFFAPGTFMSNFSASMQPRPNHSGDGTYAMNNIVTPQTCFPLIDTAKDTGKFVAAILAEPDKYEGKIFCAATKLYSMQEIADIMSKHSGKTVKYNQLPEEVFKSFMPKGLGEELCQMMLYFQDFGYYGEHSEDLVKWAGENARGQLRTLEAYLQRNPLKLE